MTLHSRLTITLAAGVALVITAFQAIQSFKVQNQFEKAGQASAQILKDNLSDNADNVERAVNFSISTAMAAGAMDIFDKVASLQKNLRGLEEFSLYAQNGRIAYSSDPSRLKTEMEAGLKQQLFTHPERLVRESAGQIDIYEPYIVKKSCIECHNNDWKADMVAGVTLFRYSKEALAKATDQSLLVTREAGRSSLVLAAVTIGGTLLAVVVLVTLLIRRVTKRLELVAQSLDHGTQRMNESASQLASTSHSIAQGASEQAASLEETSSSLEEMASMTRRNAENTHKADRLAKDARSAAEKGAADMKELAGAIQDIKVSSDDVSKIIKAIDEIAFQTNILALNAAVEAARAGESGLGFAVVADEVRSLAQRSAQAAKETSSKIEGAIAKTSRGVELSARVGRALEEIVGSVRGVDDLVSEVASASIEQSQGIAQVNLAVAEMDKVTQRNAANAEESASASQELTGQAGTLQELGINLRDLVSGHATVSDVQARALEISFQADSPTEPAQNVRYSPGRSGRASAL